MQENREHPKRQTPFLITLLKGRLTLAEYLAISSEEKKKRIAKAEIGLASPVDPKYIRIAD